MPLRLHNSLTRRLEDFAPRDPARVTFYSCGPTVYDDAHIGNFRSFLAADVLRRWIESPLCELVNDKSDGASAQREAAAGTDPARRAGPPQTSPKNPTKSPRTVVHVMNITDVGHMTDDAEGGESGEDRMAVAGKRLAEAKKSGKLPPGSATTLDPNDPFAIAEFYAQRFLQDARALGLKVAIDAEKDPTLMPRPTRCIPQMIAMIQSLITKGHAYAVGPAGQQVVYYDVQSFPDYGKLSGNTLDNLRTGAGGRVSDGNQSQKRHPADFLLWKADPSHIMKWDSPWGAGYPGWHIECSVMAAGRLAAADGTIDLHSGGEDNMFPHHECEIAQSRGHTDAPCFARTWFHARHLFIEGAKMSKSKGNFYTARDLFAKNVQPAALRLELIKTHYRTNANFTMQGLADSQRIVDRWRRIAAAGASDPHAPAPMDAPVLREFTLAMSEDLNVAGAIGVVNSWTGSLANPTATDAAILRVIDRVLGVLELEAGPSTTTDIGVYVGGATPDASIEAKLADRRAARAAKDFKRSDAIRDELLALGYAIKDVAGGKVEVSRRVGG